MATTGATDELHNHALIGRHFEEVWNQGRVERVEAYYAADFHNFGQPTDPAHLRRIVNAWRQAFPDFRYAVEAIVAAGDEVFGHCTMTGTHRGPLPLSGWAAVAPTGLPVAVPHLHRFRVRDGQIAAHWAARDDLGMLQQLGLVTPPA
jgi:predicted ester cyclase